MPRRTPRRAHAEQPPTRGRGQPTKLTPETTNAVLTAVRAGAYWDDAARRAGVGRSTVLRWRQIGERDDAPPEYREFRDAVERARADARVRMAATVMKDAAGGVLVRRTTRTLRDGTTEVDEQWTPPNGRVAIQWLERTDPARWARRPLGVEVSGPDGGPVTVDGGSITAIATRFQQFMARQDQLEDPAPAVLQGEVLGEE